MRKEKETSNREAEGDQEVQHGEGVKCCDSQALCQRGWFVLLVCWSIKGEDPSVSVTLGVKTSF